MAETEKRSVIGWDAVGKDTRSLTYGSGEVYRCAGYYRKASETSPDTWNEICGGTLDEDGIENTARRPWPAFPIFEMAHRVSTTREDRSRLQFSYVQSIS